MPLPVGLHVDLDEDGMVTQVYIGHLFSEESHKVISETEYNAIIGPPSSLFIADEVDAFEIEGFMLDDETGELVPRPDAPDIVQDGNTVTVIAAAAGTVVKVYDPVVGEEIAVENVEVEDDVEMEFEHAGNYQITVISPIPIKPTALTVRVEI